MNNNISFGASFRANALIQPMRGGKPLYKQTVSVVELNKNDFRDMNALQKIADRWDNEGRKNSGFTNYVDRIITCIKKDYAEPDVKEHYLALTMQKDHFERLEPKDILGVSMFSEDAKSAELNYLQVKPKISKTYGGQNRTYKNVGSAIIEYLKKTYKNIPIFVNAAHNAIGFYMKHGFKPYDADYPWFLHFTNKIQ